MNPDTLNYSVNSLDDAMLDRFVSIEITANLEDYTAYSLKNDPCDDVLAYLTACPDMLLRIKKAADMHRHREVSDPARLVAGTAASETVAPCRKS